MIVFVGCGFVAKYPEGGGNFAVPLQWMLGLNRRGHRAVWLEVMPSSGDPDRDDARCTLFLERTRALGVEACLLISPSDKEHELERMTVRGLSERQLRDWLAGPHLLLNLSFSVRPPFLDQFEARWLCDLDPGEIAFWMGRMELGQSHHDRFFTLGLNMGQPGCGLSDNGLAWQTFPPLVDTGWYQVAPFPQRPRFTTIGQWIWDGSIEVDGEYPDLSKRAAFAPFLDLPSLVPEVIFELAMHIGDWPDEVDRLRRLGWNWVEPHEVVPDPWRFRDYLADATGECTSIKGVDCLWQTGWVSDRAAAFLASGRPVITPDTGAGVWLPEASGFLPMGTLEEAADSVRRVLADPQRHGREARACAEQCFDAARVLEARFGL